MIKLAGAISATHRVHQSQHGLMLLITDHRPANKHRDLYKDLKRQTKSISGAMTKTKTNTNILQQQHAGFPDCDYADDELLRGFCGCDGIADLTMLLIMDMMLQKKNQR